MALPRSITYHTTADGYTVGPFISSGGNAYYLTADSGFVDAYKSADPSTTAFTVQDASNNPVTSGTIRGTTSVEHIDAYQVSDIIHVAVLSYTTPAMGDWTWYWDYFTFSMSADTWDTTPTVGSDTDASDVWSTAVDGTLSAGQIRIMVRGNDSDVVIVAKGPDVPDMGAPFDTTYHGYHNGGAGGWSTPTQVDGGAGGNHYRYGVLSNDDTSSGTYAVFWTDVTGSDLEGRLVTGASHTHETSQQIDSTATVSTTQYKSAIQYDDGGTERGFIVYHDSGAATLTVFNYDPTQTNISTGSSFESDITGADDAFTYALAAYDSSTDTRYALYILLGTPDSIKYVTSENEGTWGGATTDSSPANDTRLQWVHATVGTSPSDGSSTVIAFLYLDNTAGTAYYDEVTLAAGGTTATPGTGSLTLTGGTPTVTKTANVWVTTALAALTLTGGTPTVTASANVWTTPTVASLTLSGGQPTVSQTLIVTPSTGALSFTGGTPAVATTANVWVTPASGALSLTGGSPTVTWTVSAIPSTGSLTLTGGSPVVTWTLSATPSTGSLLLTGGTPTVTAAASVVPATGALTLTGGQAGVEIFWGYDGVTPATTNGVVVADTADFHSRAAGGQFVPGGGFWRITKLVYRWGTASATNVRLAVYRNSSLTMDDAVLVLDHGIEDPVAGTQTYTVSGSPVIAHGDYVFLAAKSQDVAVYMREYNVGPALDIDAWFSEDDVTEDADHNDPWDAVAPSSWSAATNTALAVGLYAEPVTAVRPATGSLTLTGGTPTVDAGGATVTPSTGALTLTGGTPTVTSTANVWTTPATASLTLTGGTPTVTTTANVWSTPLSGSLSLTAGSPTVTWTVSAIPTTGSLTFTGGSPTVTYTANVWLTPSAGSLSLTGGTPTVTSTANVWTTPSSGALSLTGGTPTVTWTVSSTPSTGSLTLTAGTPTVVEGAVATPSTASLTLTAGTPTVTADTSVAPSAAALILTGGQPTVTTSEVGVVPSSATLTFTGGSTFWWIDQNTPTGIWTDQTTGAGIWTDQTTSDATWTDQ